MEFQKYHSERKCSCSALLCRVLRVTALLSDSTKLCKAVLSRYYPFSNS